jgi:hypothetical protein
MRSALSRCVFAGGTRTAAELGVRNRHAYTTRLLWLLAIVLTVLCAFSGGVTVHPGRGVDSSQNAAHLSPDGAPAEARTVRPAKPAN